MSYSEERPSVSKGRRPYFFDDPNIDKLMAIIMALTAELSVIRERLDVHERLAAEKTWATAAEIEAFVISDEVRGERSEQRTKLLKRVLRVLSDELARMENEDSDASYPKPTEL